METFFTTFHFKFLLKITIAAKIMKGFEIGS